MQTMKAPYAFLTLFAVVSAQASGSRKPPQPTLEGPAGTVTAEAPSGGGLGVQTIHEEKPMTPPSDAPRSIAREYLVKFKTPEGEARRAELFHRHGVKERNPVGSDRLYLIEMPKGSDDKAISRAIEAEPDVKYIEPNLVMRILPMEKSGAPKKKLK